jgi:hypothetical protein
MRLTHQGLEGFTHPALHVGDGGAGIDAEQDLFRLLDLDHSVGHGPLAGVQPHYSTFLVNDALNLSIAGAATDATSASAASTRSANATGWESLGLPTGDAVVHAGSSGASSSNDAPPGMLPWAGGFAHEDFVRMEADTATRQHEAALDASTPGRGPFQPITFGWSRSAQWYGWENSEQMQSNVGWGAPDAPGYVQSGTVGVAVFFSESVEADPASASDHRNGADIASDTYSPDAGSGGAPAVGRAGSMGGVSEASAGWSDLHGTDLQSGSAAAAASPGVASGGAASTGAGTGGEGTSDGVGGGLTGHPVGQGSSVATGSSDSNGSSGASGGVPATDRVGGGTGASAGGALTVAGYNADNQPILETGFYTPQGEIREVSDAPALRPGSMHLVQGEQGATPMRDESGTLLYRISGGQRDGQIVLAGIAPPAGASMETVVVTGSRSDSEADRALPGTGGLRLSSAQLDDALLLPPQVGQAALVVVTAEIRSGNPTLMALGGVAVVGAYGVGALLDGEGGPTQRTASLPEELRSTKPLIHLPGPDVGTVPGYAPHLGGSPQSASPPPLLGQSPSGAQIEVLPEAQMRLDDLIIEARGYQSGTAEHKAAAWEAYQQRPNDGWDYERWSVTYEQNQTRATTAREAEIVYQQEIGWGTVQGAVLYPSVNGNLEVRKLDIVDTDNLRGVEVKTGYQSATVDNLWELERDKALVTRGWSIEWVFMDTKPSQPLIDALQAAGINVVIKVGS